MKTCKHCNKEIQPKPYANNVRFCSITCRNKALYIARGGKEYQRAYYDSKRTYNEHNGVQCLICMRYYRQLGTHITQRHGISATEYKEAYKLERSKGLLAKDLKEIKAEHALNNGTWENLKKGAPYRYYKGQKGIGVYERMPATLERIRNIKRKK